MTNLDRKIEYSINLIRKAEKIAITMQPEKGFWLAFSGGKDSQVLYHLAQMAGVNFEAHYSLTTLDPPELVHFIKRKYSNVIIDRPKQTFFHNQLEFIVSFFIISSEGTLSIFFISSFSLIIVERNN